MAHPRSVAKRDALFRISRNRCVECSYSDIQQITNGEHPLYGVALAPLFYLPLVFDLAAHGAFTVASPV